MNLTATQLDALDKARRFGGGLLERRRGGFWTYPGCRSRTGAEAPVWSVGWETIDALRNRGVLRVTKRMGMGAPCEVEIVE